MDFVTDRAAPAHRAGAARHLLAAGAVQYVIRRALCLSRRVNQKLAIIAKLLQPASNVRGLILEDNVGDSSFRAEICRSHLSDKLLGAVGLDVLAERAA